MKALIERYPYLTILMLWLFVFVFHLDVLSPNIMEARNFITAREMLTDGNWILTTMDGLPRYEKPPLPTWFAAIMGKIFGINNIAALRFPSAVVTLLMMLTVFRFSVKLTLNKMYALTVTLVLGTSFFIIFAGRNGTWDIFAHGFMVVGIYFLFKFFESESSIYKNALLSGVFIGLSFMSKGPVSHYALLFPFLMSYGFIYKFKGFNRKWIPFLMMLVVITLLSSWWAYYIYIMDTASATRIAEKESSRWLGYEVKPFYYYWSFFTQSGVWTISAFICLLYPYLKSRVSNLKAYKFVLVWTLLAVLLLSLIPTKKSRYLLPVLIPLAFTIGFYIQYLFTEFRSLTNKWEKISVYFNFGIIAVIGVLFPVAGYIYFGDKLSGNYFYFVLASIGLFFTGSFIVYNLKRQNFPLVFYGVIIFIMVTISFGFPLANIVAVNPQYNSISKLAKASFPVVSLNGHAPEMVWDYGKTSTIISKSELLDYEIKDSLGVLVYYDQDKKALDFLKKSHDIRFVETFDLNAVDVSKSGYKERLKTDFYMIKKY